MSKLAESYIEFVAKGLEEVEKGIQGIDESGRTAHKAIEFLSQSFDDYAKRNKIAIASTNLQLDAFTNLSGKAKDLMASGIQLKEVESQLTLQAKKLENSLLKTDSAFAQTTNRIINLANKEKLLGSENQSLIAKMQSMDSEAIKLAAAETGMSKSIEMSTRTLALNAAQININSGASRILLQDEIKLKEGEAQLSLQQKVLESVLLETNSAYSSAANSIVNLASKEKLLEAGNQSLITTMQSMDSEAIKIAAQEKIFAQTTEIATKSLAVKAAQLNLTSQQTTKLMVEEIKLKENEAKLAVGQKTLDNTLIKTNTSFKTTINNITNLANKEKALASENTALLARMQSVDKEAIKLAASEMKHTQATENATKKLQLEARQLNLVSGAFAKASIEAQALAKMEEKLAAKELKIAGGGKPAIQPLEKEQVKKEGKETGPAKLAEVKMKTSGGPESEKAIDKITGKLKGMQIAAVLAGGAIASGVALLTRAAMAGTVEADQLSKSYEIAGRVIGDVFAPYVRLATEMIQKITKYWSSLSAVTKTSIGNWAMLTAGIVTFAAALPAVISGIGAVIGLISAIVSPVGLAIAAIGALIGYFAGVFDKTKSWEDVLANFVEFFLNTWSRAESAFDTFCNAVVSNYDSTVGPMLEMMESGWASISDSVGGIATELGEMIAGFFGTSIEDASTFEGVMSTVVEAWMDLQASAEAVVSALMDGFMWVYEKAVRPTVDLIIGAFHSVWSFIKDAATGIFGSWTDATGGITDSVAGAVKFMFGSWKQFTATVVSLVFTIAETFAEVVNTISGLWWGMINKLAKAAAWIMEKMGIISKETADKMREAGKGDTDIFDTNAMRKKMDGYLDNMVIGMDRNKDKAKEIGKAINDMVNAPAGPELAAKLEANGRAARNIAKSVVGMVKGLEKPGGFNIKANMSFEGIGASMERLQLAFANNTGASVDKMQLVAMQGINQNMAIAAGALNQIKDKIPAVR